MKYRLLAIVLLFVTLLTIAELGLPSTGNATAVSFQDSRSQVTATFASGDTVSAEIDLGGTMPVGIQMPAAFTGTTMKFFVATAGGGTFQSAADGAGADISKTVAASRYIALDPTLLRGFRYIKLISGTAETAGRTVTVFTIPAR